MTPPKRTKCCEECAAYGFFGVIGRRPYCKDADCPCHKPASVGTPLSTILEKKRKNPKFRKAYDAEMKRLEEVEERSKTMQNKENLGTSEEVCGRYIGKIPNTVREVNPNEWCKNKKPCPNHLASEEVCGETAYFPGDDNFEPRPCQNPKPCPLHHKTVLDDCSALPMPLPAKSHPAGEQEWREMWTILSYAFEKDKEPDDDTKARLSHTVLMLLQAKDREKDEAIREMLKQVEKKIKSRVYGYDMDERSGCVEWSDVSDIFASLKK